MKIKRHELGTHFGGASLLKKTKSEEVKEHTIRDIKECLNVKSFDQYPYSDGVYLIDGMCYTIIEGVTYHYFSGKEMFHYYLTQTKNTEIALSLTDKEKSTLLQMEKHPLISKEQLAIISAIKAYKDDRKRWLDIQKTFRR